MIPQGLVFVLIEVDFFMLLAVCFLGRVVRRREDHYYGPACPDRFDLSDGVKGEGRPRLFVAM